MADFRKSANGGGEFLQAHLGNLGNCLVADFGKSANGGALQAHVGNCPVADLRKSANWGGDFLHAYFSKSVFIFYL